MSEAWEQLEAAQQKVYDLIKTKYRLKRKESLSLIPAEERIELNGYGKLINMLRKRKRLWQSQVAKEYPPKIVSKSFGEADRFWIGRVTGIDTEYRECCYEACNPLMNML